MVEIAKINYEELIEKIKATNPKGYYDIYAYLAHNGDLAYESLNEFGDHDLDTTKMDKVIETLCDLDPEIEKLCETWDINLNTSVLSKMDNNI